MDTIERQIAGIEPPRRQERQERQDFFVLEEIKSPWRGCLALLAPWRLTLIEQRRSSPLRRAVQRGVTLVEILIVVAIIAMVASGVAVFALPKFKEAQKKTAETGARVIRSAIQDWQRVNNESSCPTMSQLVQEKHIDSAANTDDP